MIAVRTRKLPDPAVPPNAGSFFHNPVVDASSLAEELAQPSATAALPAGRWARQARCRLADRTERLEGQEPRSRRHVREAGAGPGESWWRAGQRVVTLARAVQADVRRRFAVELTPEPVFL